MKLKYLDRSIHDLALHYTLCLSEESFKKELVRFRIKGREAIPWIGKTAHATVHFLEAVGQPNTAIVCLGPLKGKTLAQIHAMLVHEAAHIWQEHMIAVGEKSPSKEFEAYALQNICQQLFISYREQTKKAKP